jgi:hypothetical protein
MNVKLVREYNEGNWGYYRVLVDEEQAGYLAINDKTRRVGLNLHHRDCYPNLAIIEEVVRIRSAKKKVQYTHGFSK